jgi:hypothetical protein
VFFIRVDASGQEGEVDRISCSTEEVDVQIDRTRASLKFLGGNDAPEWCTYELQRSNNWKSPDAASTTVTELEIALGRLGVRGPSREM